MIICKYLIIPDKSISLEDKSYKNRKTVTLELGQNFDPIFEWRGES